MQTYSHSGTVPLTAGLKTVLAGAAAAAIGGIIYAYAFYWIPFVYVNVLIAIGFAGLIGGVISHTAERGKIRNNFFLRASTIVVTLLGLYVYWGAYLWALAGIGNVGLRAFSPPVLVSFAQHLFEKGSWGIKSGDPVTGWFLVAFWVAEVAVVLWFSLSIALTNLHVPFCESCEEWTEVEREKVRLAATGDEPAWQQVFAGDLPSLAAFAPAERNALDFVRLDTARCPKCDQSRFLSASAVKIKIDKKGKATEKERRLITNAILTPAQFAVVEACAKLFQEGLSEVSSPAEEVSQALAPAQPTSPNEAGN